MNQIANMLYVMLKSFQRDRILYAFVGVALLMLILVPAFSLFSMRQVQELAITLSLSAISFILLLLSTLVGASSVWRDVERRYTTSVLGLPISRATYILGKFCGMALLILVIAILLGGVSLLVINIAAAQYPSDTPIHWLNIVLAIIFSSLKFILLAAVALLFSAFSTSFFLPFFGTVAIYFAGSASQEVYEYVSGNLATAINPASRALIKGVYYLLPNLSAFDLKVHAIYGLQLSAAGLGITLAYFLIYVFLLLSLTVWIFTRRELP